MKREFDIPCEIGDRVFTINIENDSYFIKNSEVTSIQINIDNKTDITITLDTTVYGIEEIYKTIEEANNAAIALLASIRLDSSDDGNDDGLQARGYTPM